MAEQNKQCAPLGFKRVRLFKDQTLGIGSYGKVCKAQCDELPCAAKIIHETLVADPSLCLLPTQQKRKLPTTRFERECDFLSQLRHPNIVQFLGMWHDPDNGLPVLLMELMQDSLTNYVNKSNQPIPYNIQVNICHDITQALTFLHSNDIVHRDLSSNNVLLDRNMSAKVADFGMARFADIKRPMTQVSFTMCPGADHYMPPEAIDSKPKYTEKLDCFSFGVIALQMLTLKQPSPGERKRKVVIDGMEYEKSIPEVERRQEHIGEVPDSHPLLIIIKDCLNDNYKERPSAQELCNEVAALKSAPLYNESEPAFAREISSLKEKNLEKDRALQAKEEEVLQLKAQLKFRQANSGPTRRIVDQPPRISSREINTGEDGRAPLPVPRPQQIDGQRRPTGNAQRRVAPGGNGHVHQHKGGCGCLCSWKIWMIILAVVAAIFVYKWMQHPEVNTPLKVPKGVVSSWENDNRLWGSYRSNVYFGMSPRIPKSLLSGIMWYEYDTKSNIRHVCSDGDQLPRFGWLRHDGVSFGEQEIIDNVTAFKTDFVTTPNGWTARIRADAQVSSHTLVSFFYYVFNEGLGTMDFTFTNNKAKIYGYTPELKEFQMLFDVRSASSDTVYNYTVAVMEGPADQISNFVHTIRIFNFPQQRKGWPRIIQLPGKINKPQFKPNLAIYQITTYLPFEIDILFEFGGAQSNNEDLFTYMFNTRAERFDQKFEKVFQLKAKGYNKSEVNFAKAALSNLLGSISYFYGQSKVLSKDSPDIQLDYWPAPLYTAVPSRTSFPRGFLWNEGFHQLLVAHWDTSIVKDVITHWLDLMNHEGWIPREQILGAEARNKVPSEFVVQNSDHGNPPTFFLTLETLIESEERPDVIFLRQIFPRLKKWFEWFSTTQAGERTFTYRWRGRNETTNIELNPKTLTSGLNDFPRASHPTLEEYHVDLRCWMTLASEVMVKIAQILGEDCQLYWSNHRDLSDQKLLDELHWDNTSKTYSDYGNHTSDVMLYKVDVDDKSDFPKIRVARKSPTLRFVDSFGYVNLFPFLFKLVSPSSEQLDFLLSMLANESILWTDYGLRSLSKQDPFYNKYNTEHEKPYWRGAIWINMNYLACRALHHYGNVDGPYRQKAENLYKQLRSNLISNMYKEYTERGYIWEQYNDQTGRGQGTRPFTGWSSLIVLIMGEKY